MGKFLSFLLFISVVCMGRVYANDTIIIGGDYDYPPYSFINSNGQEVGYDVDVIKAVAKQIGIEVVFKFNHWDSTLNALESGKIDVIASIVYSQSREKKYDFTFPLHTEYYAIFAHKNILINDVNDLESKKPAFLPGDISNERFLIPMGLLKNPLLVNSLPEAFFSINKEECDYVVAPYALGLKIITDNKLNDIKVKGPPIIPSVYCLAVKQGDAELLARLNIGIEKLSRNGELDRIYSKWVKYAREDDQYKNRFKITIFILFGALVAILFLLLFWYSLKIQVAKKAKQIKEAEEIYQKVFNSVDDVLLVFNRQGVIVDANDRAVELYKRTHDELVGVPFTEVMSKENIPLFQGLVNSYVPETFNFSGEVKKQDGAKTTWLKVSGVRLQYASEERYMAVLHNVTDEKNSIIKLEQARKIADEANKTKTTFLGTISHEIKTPLNAILGFTGLLSKTSMSIDQLQLKEKIEQSGNKLLSLVDDVLDITKIEANRLSLKETPFLLKQVVGELVYSYVNKAKEKGIDINLNINNSIPEVVIGDESRIIQILHNLLSNSIKFTHKGKINLKVNFENKDNNKSDIKRILFSIKDTGIGISKSNLAKLFIPFVQIQNTTSRMYGGTGLGLVIAKQLVDLMKGEIFVESIEGEGSVFNVCLPLKKGDKSMIPIDYSDEAMVSGEIKGSKLLLVEDNSFNAEIFCEILSDEGAIIECAENGKRAIEILEKNSYDLILMDIEMPEMDGFETSIAIRKDLHLDVPIVALSAHSLDVEKQKAQEVGMNDYLVKPVKTEKLIGAVKKWLTKPTSIDTDYGLNNFEGNIMLYNKCLIRFFTNYKELPNNIASIYESDLLELKRLTHNLKSAAKMIGALVLSQLAENMDRNLRNDENSIKKEEIDELIELLRKVLSKINDYV